MYYVYAWVDVTSGKIIYVGKGTKNRYKVRKHNRLFDEYIRSHECTSRIEKEFLDEEAAFSYEQEMIETLKQAGECFCNINIGGAGGTSDWWTDDRRAEYSAKNVMKSENQRARMSMKNPMKNAEVAMAVGLKKKRAVVVGDREFSSVKDAAATFNVRSATVKRWCEKGVNPRMDKCRYKDSPQAAFSGNRYNLGGCRAIIYNGVRYETGIDLARELGVSNSAIVHWAKRGFTPDGIQCRYEDDTRGLRYEPRDSGWKKRKPIIVNGVWYPSKRDAEIALGLSKGYLAPYIAGTRKNSKYICKYDNQQPSCGKSDNSTAEGSTTNE